MFGDHLERRWDNLTGLVDSLEDIMALVAGGTAGQHLLHRYMPVYQVTSPEPCSLLSVVFNCRSDVLRQNCKAL